MTQVQAMPTDPDPPTNLGQVLVAARTSRGLSQQALADLIGASRSSVKNWESGRVIPNVVNLMRLGRALDMRFTDDGHGQYTALDADPAPPPSPQVVVVVVQSGSAEETAEAIRQAFRGRGD